MTKAIALSCLILASIVVAFLVGRNIGSKSNERDLYCYTSDSNVADCYPSTHWHTSAADSDPLVPFGKYLMLGPWADPINDLRNPALERIIGRSSIVANTTVCGVGLMFTAPDSYVFGDTIIESCKGIAGNAFMTILADDSVSIGGNLTEGGVVRPFGKGEPLP
jgi:hypothetical protein